MVAGIAESAGSPRQAVLRSFEMAIAVILKDGSRDGCLLVNTALELAAHDSESEEIVRRAFTGMEGFYRTMIVKGQTGGEIPPEVSPPDAARALLGLFLGLRVLVRSRPDPFLLQSIREQAEVLLGGAAPT